MSAILLSIASLCADGQINMLRYNDDFSLLKSDTIQKSSFDKIKYIRISGNSNISFGGELREQYQYYQNRNFGDAPSKNTDLRSNQLMQRVMVHANIDLGKKFRLFAQVGTTFRFFNPNGPTPEIDENHLSLHQAFADYKLGANWLIRTGRQELAYGSHRLITFREGPNTRLAFDAVTMKYKNERKKADFLVMSPVISKPGVFDDSTFKDLIFGGYITERLIDKRLLLDYYSMNFLSNRRSYNYISGRENRQSYGIRLFSQNNRLNYEFEGTYQSGKFNDLRIRAYSLSADINYKVDRTSNATVGISGNYASGDKDANDKRLNTYNPLFSKPQYGLAAPIGAANIININPYVSVSPGKRVNVSLGLYLMWRQSNSDGVYSPLGTETRPKLSILTLSKEREIGKLWSLESNYNITRNLILAVDASYFSAGRFVHETGKGKDITYLSVKASYKF